MSILELRNITKSFDGIRALDGVSLGFEQGKITGLIGPNGAGKTTLFNLVCGFLRPDGGEIYYSGRSLLKLAPWQIARMGIGRLFQDVRVFDRMTVLDNVLAAFGAQAGENALLSVLARWKILKEEKLLVERARRLLDFVGLSDKAESMADDLSYGQQKLLAIARLLAADADLLLLDEPTAGISPYRVKALLDVIRRLAREKKTVVVIEHNMNVVIEIADWVFFIDEGQVASFGMPGEVLSDPEVRAAYVGL
jgi:ABC-type branched-subunit amino acid transport system ATPase component